MPGWTATSRTSSSSARRSRSGPLRRDLAAVYARWMNQLEVRRGLDYLGIATAAEPGEVGRGEPRARRGARAQGSSSRLRPQRLRAGRHRRAVRDRPRPRVRRVRDRARRAPRPGPRHRGHAARARLRVPRAAAAQRAARDAGVERRRADGVRARRLPPHRRAPRRADEPGAATNSCSWTRCRRTSARRCCRRHDDDGFTDADPRAEREGARGARGRRHGRSPSRSARRS